MPNSQTKTSESQNSSNSNYFFIGIVVVLLLGAGVAFFQSSNQNNSVQPTVTEQAITSDETMNETIGSAEETNPMVPANNQDDSTTASAPALQPYQVYSPEALQVAQETDNNILLFFHATWCPSCRALDSEITSNLTEIPENLNIFKVNYDSETDLKKKFAVTTQHTLVQIDSAGNEITKWTGGSRIEQLLEQVQN